MWQNWQWERSTWRQSLPSRSSWRQGRHNMGCVCPPTPWTRFSVVPRLARCVDFFCGGILVFWWSCSGEVAGSTAASCDEAKWCGGREVVQSGEVVGRKRGCDLVRLRGQYRSIPTCIVGVRGGTNGECFGGIEFFLVGWRHQKID
jgi:hypothetical protein